MDPIDEFEPPEGEPTFLQCVLMGIALLLAVLFAICQAMGMGR